MYAPGGGRLSSASSELDLPCLLEADLKAHVRQQIARSIIVPVQLKRCGLSVRLIVRAPWAGKARGPDPRLVALLAKAQRCFMNLSSGHSDSVLSIAQEHGLASSQVTRVIYLAFLAPDIVNRIVRGEQPVDLNVKRLSALAPLPLDWSEQRRVMGFDG